MHSDPHLEEERWRDEREREKRGRRELHKHQEMVMDELLPKATGKEARLEKKRVRAEKRRDREISPGVACCYCNGWWNTNKAHGPNSIESCT